MFSFSLFRESDAERLNKLTQNNSEQLAEIIDTTPGSLRAKSRRNQNIIKNDIALILTNPKEFQRSHLVHSARLYPDPLLNADIRVPTNVVRSVIRKTKEGIGDALTEHAEPHDMRVLLACLQNLQKQPQTLTEQDLRIVNQNFFRHTTVINTIHDLKPLLDAAENLKPGTWKDAANAMIEKNKQKEANWCLINALQNGSAEPNKQRLFSYTCRKLIDESETETLRKLVDTKDFGDFRKEIKGLSQSNAVADARIYETILTNRFKAGTKLAANERAWLIKYYAQTTPTSIKRELIDEAALNILIEEESLTAALLSNFETALPLGSYLRLILKAYGRAINQKLDFAIRLPYLTLLEKAVTPYRFKTNDLLRDLITCVNTEPQRRTIGCDSLRSGKHQFLLKLYPYMPLYRSTLLNLAREIIKSKHPFDSESLCEVVTACHVYKKIDGSGDDPDTDRKLVNMAKRHLISTDRIIESFSLGCDTTDLKNYFNNQPVSNKIITGIAIELLRNMGRGSQSRGDLANATPFIMQRAIHRLLSHYRLSDNSDIPEILSNVTSELCCITGFKKSLVQMFYLAWDPMKPIPRVIAYILNRQKWLSISDRMWQKIDYIPHIARKDEVNISTFDLMSLVGNLNIQNVVRRNEFASALVEAKLFGHGGRHVIGTVKTDMTIECKICTNDIKQGEKVYKLDKKCEGTMCEDCMGHSFNYLYQNNKCQWDCHCHVNSNTAIAFGVNTETVLNIRHATLSSYFNKLENWTACNDQECIGGAKTTDHKAGAETECVLCHKTNKTQPEAKAKAEIDTVRMLLDYIGEKPTREFENGEGMIRECFGCGLPVQKDGACSTVTHKQGCESTFDFITGTNKTHTFYNIRNTLYRVPAQEYIPGRTSTLWKAGFYSTKKGCIPLTRNRTLMKNLISNKESWFSEYKRKKLSDIKKHKSRAHQEASNKKFAPLGNRVMYPRITKVMDKHNLVTGDLVSYQEHDVWKIGTLHINSERKQDLTVVGEDGKKRTYPSNTTKIQPLGSTPIMSHSFLPGEPIEFNVSNLPEEIKKKHFPNNAIGWRLGQVEKSDKESIWVKLTEDSRAVLLPHDSHALAPAGTHDHSISYISQITGYIGQLTTYITK